MSPSHTSYLSKLRAPTRGGWPSSSKFSSLMVQSRWLVIVTQTSLCASPSPLPPTEQTWPIQGGVTSATHYLPPSALERECFPVAVQVSPAHLRVLGGLLLFSSHPPASKGQVGRKQTPSITSHLRPSLLRSRTTQMPPVWMMFFKFEVPYKPQQKLPLKKRSTLEKQK